MYLNEEITYPVVKVVEDGKPEEMTLKSALVLAQDRDEDLVLVDENRRVCRIFDYGKEQYRQEKVAKKQKVMKTKEVKFTASTGDHDFDTKLRQINKFLSRGDDVKVTVRLRSREPFELAETMILRAFDGVDDEISRGKISQSRNMVSTVFTVR